MFLPGKLAGYNWFQSGPLVALRRASCELLEQSCHRLGVPEYHSLSQNEWPREASRAGRAPGVPLWRLQTGASRRSGVRGMAGWENKPEPA